jgi:quaternary ammonium compound-resistance protein SugE
MMESTLGWIYILIAGLFEVLFAICLKASDNFSKMLPLIGFAIGVFFSLYFLSRAMQSIPVGTAYAVWTGVGSIGTVMIGIFFYGDPTNFARLFFISLLILSLVGLKFFSGGA